MTTMNAEHKCEIAIIRISEKKYFRWDLDCTSLPLSQTAYTLHESHAVRRSDSNGVALSNDIECPDRVVGQHTSNDGNTIKHISKLASVLLAQGATTTTYFGYGIPSFGSVDSFLSEASFSLCGFSLAASVCPCVRASVCMCVCPWWILWYSFH